MQWRRAVVYDRRLDVGHTQNWRVSVLSFPAFTLFQMCEKYRPHSQGSPSPLSSELLLKTDFFFFLTFSSYLFWDVTNIWHQYKLTAMLKRLLWRMTVTEDVTFLQLVLNTFWVLMPALYFWLELRLLPEYQSSHCFHSLSTVVFYCPPGQRKSSLSPFAIVPKLKHYYQMNDVLDCSVTHHLVGSLSKHCTSEFEAALIDTFSDASGYLSVRHFASVKYHHGMDWNKILCHSAVTRDWQCLSWSPDVWSVFMICLHYYWMD